MVKPDTDGGMTQQGKQKNIAKNNMVTAQNTHELLEEMETLIELNKKMLKELEAIRSQK